jgi:glycosyltransferase involved in cell wall biosynthesis
VTVLAPHAPGVPGRWAVDGVDVRTFRYAPPPLEVLGYSRSLDADVRIKGRTLAVAPLYALAARRAVSRELRSGAYDVLHAHWVVPNGVVVAASAGQRAVFGVGLHGSDVFLAERSGLRWVVGRTLGRSRFLTGCSPELVRRVCALGFPEEEARVIPYGVDVGQFSPDPGAGRVWRRRLGIPADGALVLAVGRMAAKKGFHHLLEVAGDLLATDPALHLVLAGGGDLLEELQERAAPWRERIHFPGAVFRDTLPDLYRAADLFVLPAVHDPAGNVDGLPNVILEAMASGLPVVASEISGVPLAVTSGVHGLLVPEADPAALLDALRELVADPGKRRRMGAAGRDKAEGELTWDAVAARYRVAYREGLARRREGG